MLPESLTPLVRTAISTLSSLLVLDEPTSQDLGQLA
jgi:hypothetical protein